MGDKGEVEMTAPLQKRHWQEKKRESQVYYKYGVDCSNLDNYDLVIDTTNISPGSSGRIMSEYRRRM